MATSQQWRKYTTDQNLAIVLIVALLIGYLPLGILGELSPLLDVVVIVALLMR
jgi:hypothetical protein